MRCPPPCGKVIFSTEIKAQLFCVKTSLEGDPVLSWYYSGDCGCWHVTNTVGRGKTGKRVRWVQGFDTAPAA